MKEIAIYVSRAERLGLAGGAADFLSGAASSVSFAGGGVEAAALLDSLGIIRSGIGGARPALRLYFGQEFCGFLTPGEDEISRAMKFCEERDMPLTLVTGPVHSRNLDRMRKFIGDFAVGAGRDAEIVVNDFGMLRMAAALKGVKIVIGRALAKSKRMPRFSRCIAETGGAGQGELRLNEDQTAFLRSGNFNAPRYIEKLMAEGVSRMDMDMLPQGVRIRDGHPIKFGFYFPWVYVTRNVSCLTSHLMDGNQWAYPVESCSRPCGRVDLKLRFPIETWENVQRGNTLFQKFEGNFTEYWNNPAFDRIVFEPVIPI